MQYTYYMPSRILFGRGQIKNLHKEVMPGKKALIVISCGTSVRKYGYLDTLKEQLDLANISYEIYDKILPNPINIHVDEGAQLAKKMGCDFVVGLGGGSVLDAAKGIATMATNEGKLWDYVGAGTGKGKQLPNDSLPIVAITTTAGTGTEADPWLVITNVDTKEKIGMGFSKTFPTLSVVDPELMLTVPEKLTAYQGFDALFHSTEGYINRNNNPINDMTALKAIELVGKYLPTAVKDGSNIEARENVALANTLAGMVESMAGCTSAHAMEHPLSGHNPSLEHGAGLIMLSEAYYSYWAKVGVVDDRLINMAKALGKADAKEPLDFVVALRNLIIACGTDDLKMSDYGIKEEDLPMYANDAYLTMGGLFQVDPVDMPYEDCLAILKEAYK